MKSIQDLARAVGVPPWKVQDQLRRINDRRNLVFQYQKGWTKGRKMLLESEIPTWMAYHPEIREKYFSDDMDAHEREKAMQRFLKDYPELRLKA